MTTLIVDGIKRDPDLLPKLAHYKVGSLILTPLTCGLGNFIITEVFWTSKSNKTVLGRTHQSP